MPDTSHVDYSTKIPNNVALHEDGFDVRRVDLGTALIDLVPDAAPKVKPAVGIEKAQVSREKPPGAHAQGG